MDKSLPVLEVLPDFLLHGLLGLGVAHLVLRDDALKIDFRLDEVSRGEQVVVIHVLDEGLQASSLLNALAAHLLCHFQWVSVDSSHQSVGKLSVLRKSVAWTYLLAGIVVVSNDDGLLSGMSSSEHNAYSAGLHTKKRS